MLNQIFNENCLDTMKRMKEGSIDMILTSPPYDSLKTYKGSSEFDFNRIAPSLIRVLKQGGALVWVVADATIKGSETGTSFRQALAFMEQGLKLHDTMIYRKQTYIPMATHRRYEQAFEYMFVFCKGNISTFNPLMVPCKQKGRVRSRSFYKKSSDEFPICTDKQLPTKETKKMSNVWDIVPNCGASGIKGHPAQMPESLASQHIESWSNEKEIVYDPFMGSGTTAKAALLLNRYFVGSEINSDYTKIALDRIKDLY